MVTYKNFIGGDYVKNESGLTFDVINPSTSELTYRVEVADNKIRELAIETAQTGFEEWSKTSEMDRSRILRKAAESLRNRKDELAKIEVEDTGRPIQEVLVVDIASGGDAIEYFSGLAYTLEGSHQSFGNNCFYTKREPLGICAGIGTWNYPLQIACWKAASALSCGNAMIFKPSEETPLGALKLAETFIDAGVPPGVFNVIQGGEEVGSWLVKHEKTAKVSFTGEVYKGKKVNNSAALNLTDATMELGGKSSLIIFDDADLDSAVSAAISGNFYTQGEMCTSCTRVFLHANLHEEFLSRLKSHITKNIIIGNPLNETVNFGALISMNHQNKVLSYIKKGIEEGAKLLTGGKRIHPSSAPNGYFIEPTVFIDCNDDMSIVKDEIFGPVMTILTFDTEEEVVARANNTDYGLAVGVFTADITQAHRVIDLLEAGTCWINAYGGSPFEMLVGGDKQS